MLPKRQLEKTRGSLLKKRERIRVASRVQFEISQAPDRSSVRTLVSANCGPRAEQDHIERSLRGKLIITLTDQRLIIARSPAFSSQLRLVHEWPAKAIRISGNRRKVGNSVVHITVPGGDKLTFELLGGNRIRDWLNVRFKR